MSFWSKNIVNDINYLDILPFLNNIMGAMTKSVFRTTLYASTLAMGVGIPISQAMHIVDRLGVTWMVTAKDWMQVVIPSVVRSNAFLSWLMLWKVPALLKAQSFATSCIYPSIGQAALLTLAIANNPSDGPSSFLAASTQLAAKLVFPFLKSQLFILAPFALRNQTVFWQFALQSSLSLGLWTLFKGLDYSPDSLHSPLLKQLTEVPFSQYFLWVVPIVRPFMKDLVEFLKNVAVKLWRCAKDVVTFSRDCLVDCANVSVKLWRWMITDLFPFVWDRLVDCVEFLKDLPMKIWRWTMDLLTFVWDRLVDCVKFLRDLPMKIWRWTMDLLTFVWDRLVDCVEFLKDLSVKLWRWIIMDLLPYVWDRLVDCVEFLKDLPMKLWRWTMDLMTFVWDRLVDCVKFLKDLPMKLWRWTMDLLTFIWDRLVDCVEILKELPRYLERLYRSVVRIVSRYADIVGRYIEELSVYLVKTMESMWESFLHGLQFGLDSCKHLYDLVMEGRWLFFVEYLVIAAVALLGPLFQMHIWYCILTKATIPWSPYLSSVNFAAYAAYCIFRELSNDNIRLALNIQQPFYLLQFLVSIISTVVVLTANHSNTQNWRFVWTQGTSFLFVSWVVWTFLHIRKTV